MLLYHGSAAGGLTRLTGQPCVYLTPYPCYALCYIRDPNVNYVTCGVDKDGVVRYDENFPEQLRTLYAGRSGWLYRCGEGDGAPIQTSQTRFSALRNRANWPSTAGKRAARPTGAPSGK